jgi:hypothetical protein
VPRPSITSARPSTPKSDAFAGRTFFSEREYRNALAHKKGYRSWYWQQRARPATRGPRVVRSLRASEREARGRALEALSIMRREGVSLSTAAKRAGTTPNNALRHAGPALERRGGRYFATIGDRLARLMLVFGRDVGIVTVSVRGSRQASLIGGHWNAVHGYLATGSSSALRPYAGKSVAGVEFETDLDVIDELARAGELEFEDIYEVAA